MKCENHKIIKNIVEILIKNFTIKIYLAIGIRYRASFIFEIIRKSFWNVVYTLDCDIE